MSLEEFYQFFKFSIFCMFSWFRHFLKYVCQSKMIFWFFPSMNLQMWDPQHKSDESIWCQSKKSGKCFEKSLFVRKWKTNLPFFWSSADQLTSNPALLYWLRISSTIKLISMPWRRIMDWKINDFANFQNYAFFSISTNIFYQNDFLIKQTMI